LKYVVTCLHFEISEPAQPAGLRFSGADRIKKHAKSSRDEAGEKKPADQGKLKSDMIEIEAQV
jgi:hypothetical protein